MKKSLLSFVLLFAFAAFAFAGSDCCGGTDTDSPDCCGSKACQVETCCGSSDCDADACCGGDTCGDKKKGCCEGEATCCGK